MINDRFLNSLVVLLPGYLLLRCLLLSLPGIIIRTRYTDKSQRRCCNPHRRCHVAS